MEQLTKNQLQLFASTIMPDLYLMQERMNRRRKADGAIYHLADSADLAALHCQPATSRRPLS